MTIQGNAVEGSMINSNAAGDGLKYASNALNIEPNDFAGTGLEDDGSDNLRLASQMAGFLSPIFFEKLMYHRCYYIQFSIHFFTKF